jgi:hypothetical protein
MDLSRTVMGRRSKLRAPLIITRTVRASGGQATRHSKCAVCDDEAERGEAPTLPRHADKTAEKLASRRGGRR